MVDCFVNQERRLLNSRYHTAGHLLGNIVELEYPSLKAIKGHAFPGEAVEFVETDSPTSFQGDKGLETSLIQISIN